MVRRTAGEILIREQLGTVNKGQHHGESITDVSSLPSTSPSIVSRRECPSSCQSAAMRSDCDAKSFVRAPPPVQLALEHRSPQLIIVILPRCLESHFEPGCLLLTHATRRSSSSCNIIDMWRDRSAPKTTGV